MNTRTKRPLGILPRRSFAFESRIRTSGRLREAQSNPAAWQPRPRRAARFESSHCVGRGLLHSASAVSVRAAKAAYPQAPSSSQNRTRCAGLRFCFLDWLGIRYEHSGQKSTDFITKSVLLRTFWTTFIRLFNGRATNGVTLQSTSLLFSAFIPLTEDTSLCRPSWVLRKQGQTCSRE